MTDYGRQVTSRNLESEFSRQMTEPGKPGKLATFLAMAVVAVIFGFLLGGALPSYP